MAPPQTPVTSALSRPNITASPVNVTLTITAVLVTGAENAFAFAVCQSLSLSPGAFWQLPGGHLPRLYLDCKAKEPCGLLHGSHAKSPLSAYGLRRPVQSCLPNLHPFPDSAGSLSLICIAPALLRLLFTL